MKAIVSNNAWGELAVPITETDGSLLLSGTGEKFPTPVLNDSYFYCTLVDEYNNVEIVRCIQRNGPEMIIRRGEDGTAPRAFPAGAKVELRPCAALFNDKASLYDLEKASDDLTEDYSKAIQNLAETTQNRIAGIEAAYATTAVLEAKVKELTKLVSDTKEELTEFADEKFATADDFTSEKLPAGVIMPYMGTREPEGWLFLNGQLVRRDKYPKLYEMFGTKYGDGNSSELFKLPLLQDRFLQGVLASSVNLGNDIEAGLPNIVGKFPSGGRAGSYSYTEGVFVQDGNSGQRWDGHDYYTQVVKLDASRGNPVYGKSTTVQPPAFGVVYMIKAG